MSSSFLEIVELDDGSFALRRMEDEGESLVEIHFSDEVKNFLGDHKAAIIKAMVGAGVQAAGAVSKSVMEAEDKKQAERILH
jgi:hypothetical protein